MKKLLILMLVMSVFLCSSITVASAEEVLIIFDSISVDGTVEQALLKNFTVSVEGSISVAGVELLVEGMSLGEDTEAPYSFALDENFLGDCTAEAIVRAEDGSYYHAEKNFAVVELAKGTVVSADFADFEGGIGDVGTEHWINEQGLREAYDREDENGLCLRLYYPEGDHTGHACNSTCDKWPQFRHYGKEADRNRGTIVHFETDFYVDQPERGTGRGWSSYSWDTYGPTSDGSKTNNIITISLNASGCTLKCADESIALNQQQWYRIAFEHDWTNGNTSLWIDGEEVLKNVIAPRPNDLTKLSRLQGNINLYGGEARFDNWDMWMILSSPVATGLSDDSEKLTYTDDAVTLGLTQGISTIDTSALKLSNEIGEVKIETAEVSLDDKTITVIPVGGFLPSNIYELTIPEKTVFSGGELAKPLKIKFKTTPSELDVVSGKIKKGADVSFLAELVNSTGEAKNLTTYLCAYKNGIFYKLTKAEVSVSSDGASVVTTTEPIEKGEQMTYKAFVVDIDGKPVCDKFYTLELE